MRRSLLGNWVEWMGAFLLETQEQENRRQSESPVVRSDERSRHWDSKGFEMKSVNRDQDSHRHVFKLWTPRLSSTTNAMRPMPVSNAFGGFQRRSADGNVQWVWNVTLEGIERSQGSDLFICMFSIHSSLHFLTLTVRVPMQISHFHPPVSRCSYG